IQGAVDIQPADIIGVRTYDRNTNKFDFAPGPIFSNVFLADEINRMTPKAQGSLLESLAERQVTLDNITYPLPSPFMVVATQNPFEMEGTFQLIESQKDRFTFCVILSQLSSDDEAEILSREMNKQLDLEKIIEADKPLITLEDVKRMQETARNVYASPDILAYIADIVTATRKHDDIKLGISTRGSLALLRGVQSYAAIQGRSYVIPDDVKYIVPFAFSHRLILKREAQLGGSTVSKVISGILNTIPVR
ncbi:MAG: MoxR family ATPase, partial [Methanocorpusculum sp.]|nr:MoxR family ATPase [Methanocorpusculum sp.]